MIHEWGSINSASVQVGTLPSTKLLRAYSLRAGCAKSSQKCATWKYCLTLLNPTSHISVRHFKPKQRGGVSARAVKPFKTLLLAANVTLDNGNVPSMGHREA